MRIVGLELGRVTLLVDLLEIGPTFGIPYDLLAAVLHNRYKFAALPKAPTQEAPQPVFRFERGQLPNGGLITLFEIHPQGLVVQAIDTNVADAFLADVLATGAKEYGLRAPSPPPLKVYNSSLVVEFEADMGRLISGWEQLSVLMSASLKRLYAIEKSVELRSVSFKPDPETISTRLASGLLSDFLLERRSHAPFQLQRFYSLAPLPTQAHIEFLETLEETAKRAASG
jgi:hypothetical protein